MFCPACGAEIEVDRRVAHLVVCDSCDSTVILDARAARISGRMAALKPPAGTLYRGAEGQVMDRHFRVVGRVRYGWTSGFWDEWFLAFEDGSTAWISEDGDDLTLESATTVGALPFDWNGTGPGETVLLGTTAFHVDEKGVATCEGGEGQLPFPIVPGEEVPFLDLGGGGQFATVEFESDAIRIFRGRRLDAGELELDVSREDAGVGPDAVTAGGAGARARVVKGEGPTLKVSCEACAAPLEGVEPGEGSHTCEYCGHVLDLSLKRVDCPGCGAQAPLHGGEGTEALVCHKCQSLIDLSGDAPSVLADMSRVRRPVLGLKLGATGTLRGLKVRIIGHIRYVEKDMWGTYTTDEFLLQPRIGKPHWLVLEDGHFSLTEELDDRPTGVMPKGMSKGNSFGFQGITWRVHESLLGGVEVGFVDGELPWVAKVGDKNGYMDAASPPYLLSAEWTDTEMEWYRAEYLPRDEVAEAFGVDVLRFPPVSGVPPHQPYPISAFRKQAAGVMSLFFCIFLALMVFSFSRGVAVTSLDMQGTALAEEYLTEPFTIATADTVCQARFWSPVDNSWVYLDGALIDAEDKALFDFSAQVSYYHGYSGGESWTEGSKEDDLMFLVREPGEYRFLIQGQSGTGNNPIGTGVDRMVRVSVWSGVELTRYYIFLVFFCFVWILVEGLAYGAFVGKRSGAGDDDDD